MQGENALNAMPKEIFNPVVIKINAQDENKKEIEELQRIGKETIEEDLKNNSTFKNTSTNRFSQTDRMRESAAVSPVV